MQFDEFDKKIKEAADHHHPAYDEQAWTKMEKLLNKHLPQKEDDRRRFIFFLLFFLGVGTAGLLIVKPWKGNKVIAATENTVQQKSPVIPPSAPEEGKEKKATNNVTEKNNDKVSNTVIVDNNILLPDLGLTNQTQNLNRNNNTNKNTITTEVILLNSKPKTKQPVEKNNKKGEDNVSKNDSPDKNEPGAAIVKTTNSVQHTNPVNDVMSDHKKQNDETVTKDPLHANLRKPSSNDEPTNITDAKKESQPIVQSKAKKLNPKSSKASSFFISLSAGPDVSFVNKSKLGRMKLFAGVGLGYTFRDRLTIRTGFYSGRKIYTASPDAYHAPANFYTYYPYLEKVDADCKIYEIPINLSYNFSHSVKQSWFATVGFSSYLMKRETYNYSYKYFPWGPLENRKRTLENVNKHFFSGLSLSMGYQYNINKRISFAIEPYIKLPLSGVGYGNVKLNSGGILFSAGFKPFGSKKKPATKQ